MSYEEGHLWDAFGAARRADNELAGALRGVPEPQRAKMEKVLGVRERALVDMVDLSRRDAVDEAGKGIDYIGLKRFCGSGFAPSGFRAWWEQVIDVDDSREGVAKQFFGAVYRQLQSPTKDRSIPLARALIRRHQRSSGRGHPLLSTFDEYDLSAEPSDTMESLLLVIVSCFGAEMGEQADAEESLEVGIKLCFRLHVILQEQLPAPPASPPQRPAVVVPFPAKAEAPTPETK